MPECTRIGRCVFGALARRFMLVRALFRSWLRVYDTLRLGQLLDALVVHVRLDHVCALVFPRLPLYVYSFPQELKNHSPFINNDHYFLFLLYVSRDQMCV